MKTPTPDTCLIERRYSGPGYIAGLLLIWLACLLLLPIAVPALLCLLARNRYVMRAEGRAAR